jgi:hypothetical protein
MNSSFRLWLSLCALVAVMLVQVARGQAKQVIWQLGVEDGGQSEFSGENTYTDPPGSAELLDDDFYFAGTYPDSVGVVATTEPLTNFERALTPGNYMSRIHFNLDASTAKATNDLKVTVALCCLGSVDGVYTHDLVMRFNGLEFFTVTELATSLLVEQTVKASAVEAKVGENIIEIERTGGTPSSWIQFDYLRLEIPSADSDNDGLPDAYEKLHPTFLNPNDPTDAAKDQDSDTLTNLEEYKLGTDPSKADSDGDTLSDGDEVNTSRTNPLASDSDGDGLSDPDEINLHKTNPINADSDGDSLSDGHEIKSTLTDPLKADTDGDGMSDSLEIQLGSNPLDASSTAVAFKPLWILGTPDDSQAEFAGEAEGSPAAPGSPDALDDDYYFAGTYPDPIGEVAADEPWTNFERALTSGNHFSRVHFNLTTAQVTTNSEYLLTFPLIQLGSASGQSSHDISFRFNGVEFRKETALANPKKIEQVVKAPEVKAVVGENIIELERTGGSGTSWIQFDYLQADYRENTAPPARPKLSIGRSADTLTIQWAPTGGTLESATSLSGTPTWTVVGTDNPATVQIAPENRFYRVKR